MPSASIPATGNAAYCRKMRFASGVPSPSKSVLSPDLFAGAQSFLPEIVLAAHQESPPPARETANTAGFHRECRNAYRLLCEWLVDGRNPKAAARICTAYETWRLYDDQRQRLVASQLDWMLGHESLSRDVADMISRIQTESEDAGL